MHGAVDTHDSMGLPHAKLTHAAVCMCHYQVEQQEVHALRQEVAQLRTSNELMRRSHETLLRDNQRLQAKLERLEHVFASSEAAALL